MDNRDWITELEHFLFETTEEIMKRRYTYDSSLANGARKHSEYMAKEDKLVHAPDYFLWGLAENVGWAEIGNAYVRTLIRIACQFRDNRVHAGNLQRFRKIGIGIAFIYPKIYATERFRVE